MPLISSDLKGNKTLDMKFIANLVFEVLCYSAEKEREKLSQRTKEALAIKKANGIKLGRPNTYDEELINNAMNDYLKGMKIKDISIKYNVSVDRVNVWKRERNIDRNKRNRKDI
jgi:DNA invertase Pin-like site-specific DNA recombinase